MFLRRFASAEKEGGTSRVCGTHVDCEGPCRMWTSSPASQFDAWVDTRMRCQAGQLLYANQIQLPHFCVAHVIWALVGRDIPSLPEFGLRFEV